MHRDKPQLIKTDINLHHVYQAVLLPMYVIILYGIQMSSNKANIKTQISSPLINALSSMTII